MILLLLGQWKRHTARYYYVVRMFESNFAPIAHWRVTDLWSRRRRHYLENDEHSCQVFKTIY